MNFALKHALIDYPGPQYEVAGKLGVSHSTISKFIFGIQEPTKEQKKRLASLLKKKEVDLFPSPAEVS